MNWKIIYIAIATSLIAFCLGWYLRDRKQFLMDVNDIKEPVYTVSEINSKTVFPQLGLDNLKMNTSQNSDSINYAKKIRGRFIMKGTNNACFNFFSQKLISWTNDETPFDPDTFKIRWINNTTFITRDIKRRNENCPPRVWVYQVVSLKGRHLILNEIWTGWNNFKDERTEYIKPASRKLR